MVGNLLEQMSNFAGLKMAKHFQEVLENDKANFFSMEQEGEHAEKIEVLAMGTGIYVQGYELIKIDPVTGPHGHYQAAFKFIESNAEGAHFDVKKVKNAMVLADDDL